jgi:hypothetical protein
MNEFYLRYSFNCEYYIILLNILHWFVVNCFYFLVAENMPKTKRYAKHAERTKTIAMGP